jgi:hypothetical protein
MDRIKVTDDDLAMEKRTKEKAAAETSSSESGVAEAATTDSDEPVKGSVRGNYGRMKFPADSAPTETKKTKGGDYPVYKKDSDPAKSFAKAFASARKAGKKKFDWEGRSYTTQLN